MVDMVAVLNLLAPKRPDQNSLFVLCNLHNCISGRASEEKLGMLFGNGLYTPVRLPIFFDGVIGEFAKRGPAYLIVRGTYLRTHF